MDAGVLGIGFLVAVFALFVLFAFYGHGASVMMLLAFLMGVLTWFAVAAAPTPTDARTARAPAGRPLPAERPPGP